MSPDPGASSGMSAWQEFPVSSLRAVSAPKSPRHRCAAGVRRSRKKPRPAGPRQPGQHPQAGPHRRERAEQGVDEGRPDARPARAHVPPGLAVAGVCGLHQARAHLEIAVQQRPGAVGSGVAEDRGCVAPAQSVILQRHCRDRGRRSGHRVEGTEGVADEVRVHVPGTPYGSPDLRLRFEQQHLPAGVGQPVGRHQPVRTRAYDNGVHFLRQCGQWATAFSAPAPVSERTDNSS